MDVLFPPGPQKSLLLGNAPAFKDAPLDFMLQAARTYGNIVHFRFGPSHAYLLTQPNDACDILVGRFDQFSDRHSLLRALNSAMGHDLFAPKDKITKGKLRRGAFKSAWLDPFMGDIARISAQAFDDWRTNVKSGDPLPMLYRLTRRILERALFGDTDDRLMPLIERLERAIFVTRADRGFQSPLTLPVWMPTADNRQRQQAAAEIAQIGQSLAEDQRLRRRDSLFTRLLQTADSGAEALEELLALFCAGYDAAATTAWAWYQLAQNPEAAETLQAETDRVLGSRTPTADDLPDLAFAPMVVKETLRLYPPVWLIHRQAKRETRIGEYYVPSGSTIFISPYIMHHSARYFTSPEKFLPERFSDTWARRGGASAYMPFGASQYSGSQHEFTVALAALMLTTAVQRCQPTLTHAADVSIDFNHSLRPQGLHIELTPRTAAAAAPAV